MLSAEACERRVIELLAVNGGQLSFAEIYGISGLSEARCRGALRSLYLEGKVTYKAQYRKSRLYTLKVKE